MSLIYFATQKNNEVSDVKEKAALLLLTSIELLANDIAMCSTRVKTSVVFIERSLAPHEKLVRQESSK